MKKHIQYPLLLALALILYGGALTATAQSVPDPKDCYTQYLDAHPDLVILGDDPAFGTSTISTSSALLATTIPLGSNYFFVAGTFTVDQSISFGLCTFLMAPNAKIEVTPGYNLTLLEDTLKAGCEYMWEGIYAMLSSTSPSVITIQRSHIQDMLYGVQINAHDHRLVASSNQFINNERSIYFKEALSTYSGSVTRNSFFTSSSLLYPPRSGQIGDKAIEIFRCTSMLIGNNAYTGQGNDFTDLNCGIYIYNSSESAPSSDISLIDNTFTRIKGVTYSSTFNPVTDYMGAAIWAKVDAGISIVRVKSLVNVGDCFFRDCDKGIMLDRINSEVKFVEMDDVVYGVATDNSATSHSISANELYNTYYGIYVHGTPASGLGIDIDKNIITTNSQLSYRPFPGMSPYELTYPIGIWVENPANTYTNTFNIIGNEIDVKASRGVGIHLTAMGSAANTELNQIRLVPADTAIPTCTNCPADVGDYIHAGIRDFNGNNAAKIIGNDIWGNAVTLRPITSFAHTAYVYEPSCILLITTKSQVTCNDMDSTRYGIQVRGACNNTVGTTMYKHVTGNRMYEHAIGIMMQGTGSNVMLGLYIGSTTYDNNNQFLGSSWATDTQPLGTCATKIMYNEAPLPVVAPATQRIIFTAVTGYLDCQSFEEPSVGLGRYALNPPNVGYTPAPCSTKYAPFHRTTNSYPAEALEYMESVAHGNDPYGVVGNVGLWLAEKDLYENLYNDPDALSASTVLDSFYTSLQTSPFEGMRIAEQAYNQLLDSATRSDSMTYAAALAAASAANLAIVPSNDMEQAEQDINYVMLSYLQWGRDSLTTADENVVRTLAASCYYSLGTAVLKARYIYHGAYGLDPFDDDALCAVSNGARKTGAALQAVKVYPNPSSGRITIEYAADKNADEAVLEIHAITGQLVKTVALPVSATAHTVDISGLIPGMYYYGLRVDGELKGAGKLIINQ